MDVAGATPTRHVEVRTKFSTADPTPVNSLIKVGRPVRLSKVASAAARPPFDPQEATTGLRLQSRRTSALYRTAARQVEPSAVHLEAILGVTSDSQVVEVCRLALVDRPTFMAAQGRKAWFKALTAVLADRPVEVVRLRIDTMRPDTDQLVRPVEGRSAVAGQVQTKDTFLATLGVPCVTPNKVPAWHIAA